MTRAAIIALLTLAACGPPTPSVDAGAIFQCSMPETGGCHGAWTVPVCGDAYMIVCDRGTGAWAYSGCPLMGDGGLVCPHGDPPACVDIGGPCDAPRSVCGPDYSGGC